MHTSHVSFNQYRSRFDLALVLFALVFLSTGTTANAQSGTARARGTSQAASAGQSTVKGRVFYKDNAQPLKGVRARIFTSNDDADNPSGRGLFAFTNDRGEFRVNDLAAGKYYVTLEGPGVAMPSGFGMRIPLPMSAIPKPEDFEEIIPKHDAEFSVDGTNTVEVEVRIARGGTISGKVMKPNGSPAANVAVNFISREGNVNGPYTSRFSTQTDKNGAYHIDNIPAGDYVVAAAMEDKRGLVDMRARLRGETQIVTYHPAAIIIRDALSVRVDPGRETSGVNVTLVERNSVAVSGTVVRQQDGSPLVGATVLLRNKESELGGSLIPGMGQRTTHSDADGRWSFSNVMAGSYVLTALSPASPPTRFPGQEVPDREQSYRESRQRFLIAQQDLAVAGADLSGISMAIIGPGSITGVVEAESGGIVPSNLVIFLELIREGNRPGPPLPVRVKPDGSFSLSGIQGGDVYLSVALSPDSKYAIQSVRAKGDDLRRTPLKIVEGAEAGPVQIVISSGVGVLSGLVLSEKTSQGLSDLVVLLAPVESEKQRFRTAYLTTRTSSDGTFSVSGAPGEYFIFARKREELPPIVTEEFVRTGARGAQHVVLVAGEQKRIELRVP